MTLQRASCQQRNTRFAAQDKWSVVVRLQPRQWSRRLVVSAHQRLQVVFVTTEVSPWSKAGGLGDVMAALPAALAAKGHRVMTVSPRYSNYTDVRDTGVQLPVQLPLDVLHLEEQRQQLEQQMLLQQQQQQQQQLQDAQDAAALLQQQQLPASSAAAEDVEAAAEMYQRSEYFTAAGSSTAAGNAAGGSSGLRYARYYMSCSAGVDRVFVDHPLYSGGSDSSAGSSIPWPAGVLSTYCHPPGSMAAARNAPDLAAAASVLCQAALAAPVLLWGLGDKLDHHQQQQQAVWSEQQRELQRDWAMLLQLLGLENEQQQSLDPLDSLRPGGVFASINSSTSTSCGISSSGVSALLASAARQREARLAAEMRHPQQVVSGVVQPVLLGTGGSEVDRRWAVCDLLLPQQQRRQALQQQQQQQAAAGVGQQQQGSPIIFVGNDWPCGVLPLWLDAYRGNEAAGSSRRKQQQQQQQRQQPGPPAAAGGVQAEQQLQEPPKQMQECVAQSALQQQGQEQEGGEQQLLPYAEWLEKQDQQQQQWEVASLEAQPMLPVQKLQLQDIGLQQQRQQLQQKAGATGVLPGDSACDSEQSPQSSSSSSSGGGSLLLADEQSVDDWLTAAGYTPASVHDRQLTTAVSEAIAAGRVPQERLPGLLAGQSQLQLLLAQEQLLGVAIERLKLSAVNVSQTLLQVQQRQDVPPGIGASAAAGQQQEQQLQEQLPHTRQLQLLQQMLGRQLGDARVVFAIHNYGYQGIFKGRHNFDRLGLPGRMLSAFVSPLARAAARAAAAAGAVTGAAVSAVNSQLAALAGILQQLSPEHAADRNDSSSNSGGGSGNVLALSSDSTAGNPGLGLFSSLQAMLTKDSLAATAAALVQAETAQKLQQPQGPDQQGRQSPLEQQQGSGGWPSLDADEGSFEDPELLEGLHDVLAAAAANTGWEPPQENRHPQDQQPQLGSMDESSSSFDDDIDAAVDVNWLRAGLAASDVLVTVSEGYADELLQGMDPSGPANPELQALLASKGLTAVLNGLDTSFWDPSKDPLLPSLVRFDPETAGSGKAAAKRLLQQRLGLAVDPAAPLFVFVGRLTQQKGVDVILAALPQLMRQPAAVGRPPSPGRSQWAQRLQQAALGRPPSPKAAAAASAASAAADAVRASSSSSGDSLSVAGGAAASAGELQVALLGNGERWMEDVLGQLDGRYPGRAVGVPAFNEPLAHLMMAGADFLLVPSRFEPCGLVALAGLRYGAVPLGTATGGLGDVVTPAVGYRLLNPGPEGDTGSFRKALRSLVNTVQDAAAEYGSPAHEARRAAAMAVDVSWQQPCAAWEQLLLQLCQGTDSTPSRSSSSRSGTAVAAERPVLPVQPLQLEPGEDAELSGAVAKQKQSPATAKPAVTLPARRRR